MMNIAVLMSAGVGRRFGEETPKQYQLIGGRQVISYVIDTIRKAKTIDKLLIVANMEYKDLIHNTYGAEFVEGGKERNNSLRNALEYIKRNYPCKKIIVLDAVRPLIKAEVIDSFIDSLDKHMVVATAKKVTDSLGCYDMHTVDRDRYYLLSSPEAFDFDLIYDKMDGNSPLVEVIQQFPEGIDTYLYFDYINNFKITYKQDLRLAELMLKDEGIIHY
jgi:2-C-methyl-D-erythritol 4-phosphate cytidylyltransferase/2-C-methyl-D-erythritol 2,4-cyclodiphosphate synthase